MMIKMTGVDGWCLIKRKWIACPICALERNSSCTDPESGVAE